VKEHEMFRAISDKDFRKNKIAIVAEYHRNKGDSKENKLFRNKREEVKAC
jgi:hypothetical protein